MEEISLDLIKFESIDYQHLPQINYPPFDFRGYTGATDGIIGVLKEKGLRNGVMLNIPNILNFPYFKNCINFSSIKVVFDRHRLTNKEYGYDINDDWVYMPNASIDSLFTYQNDKAKFLGFYLNKFKPRVLLKDNRINILQKQDTYNKHIEYVAKKYSISIVDINLLYEKVGNGTLVSDNGKKVTDKEFFSSDGLYPSAYGQAIIANECIKTINAFYKTKIELINTDFYLKK